MPEVFRIRKAPNATPASHRGHRALREMGVRLYRAIPNGKLATPLYSHQVDFFSKWVEAEAMAESTTDRVISFVQKDIVCRYGVPRVLQADNGTQFASKKFAAFCAAWCIDLKFTSVAHPQANGLAEVTNRMVIRAIKRCLGNAKGSWADELPLVLWGYRTGFRTATGFSPFNLAYRVEAHLPIEANYPNIREYVHDPQDAADARLADLDLLDELRDEAAFNVRTRNENLAREYDTRIIPKAFKPGDLVLRRADVSTPGLASGKLDPKWEGPYRVTAASVLGACTLETIDGDELPRSWHPINLRRYEQS